MIKCGVDNLKDEVSAKLEAFGHSNVKINLAHQFSTSASDPSEVFILQRYSKRWQTFVDVDSIFMVDDGDRLTVIPAPSLVVAEKASGKLAESILSKVQKPSKAEAKSLAKYFPSPGSSSSTARKSFNPSVGLVSQKKKRSATKRAERPSTISVIMMERYCPSIPKGKKRQRLASKGLIQSLRFTRSMSCQEVKTKIMRAFGVDSYVVLDCDCTGHNLIKCADEACTIDGTKVVERKGALYLCKEFNVVSHNYMHACMHAGTVILYHESHDCM